MSLAGGRVWLEDVVEDAQTGQRDELEQGRTLHAHAPHEELDHSAQAHLPAAVVAQHRVAQQHHLVPHRASL